MSSLHGAKQIKDYFTLCHISQTFQYLKNKQYVLKFLAILQSIVLRN